MKSVQKRYSDASQKREEKLCCPVSYNAKFLEAIPDEVIERDYGCGDPSQYVRPGETVLDLGSGGGKICFIASQVVGEKGRVIGVDMTTDMLALARKNAPIVAKKIGFSNVEFRRGYIQDLKKNPDALNEYLKNNPVKNSEDAEKWEQFQKENPLIPDNSIDIIVSNCVLNLVSDKEKKQLFSEMFRVLKKGGRIAISDIVSDENSHPHLKADKQLWSGCISGALQESEFAKMLETEGFYGITLDNFSTNPWRVVEGIEYRSVTYLAWKGKEGPCWEKNQAVIYKGPWKEVVDDDGHIYRRGDRIAVCEKTFALLQKEPYAAHIFPVDSAQKVSEKIPFDCRRSRIRDPKETKKGVAKKTRSPRQKNCC